jgi:hypothetical protein
MSAEKYAQWIVENQDKKGTPDFETVAQAYRAARGGEETANQPTLRQKVISSAPARALQGARDPIDAAAQLLPRGLEFLSSAGGLAPNPVSEFFGSEAGRVDKGIEKYDRELEQARKATGQEGFDFARFGGNVISPANLAIAAKLPVAATTGARVMQGAALGGVGGLLSPVNTEQNPDFMATKLGQTALGAAAGGVATPLLGKVGDYAASKFAATQRPTPNTVNRIVETYAKDLGLEWQNLSRLQKEKFQTEFYDQAVKSVQAKYGENAAAGMRAADFDALGMPYTLGQVTRDPAQFALERNLSQTSPELTQRLSEQARLLQNKVGSFSFGAQSQQQAGASIVDSLKKIDESMQSSVSNAYKAARLSAGKDVEVPMGGLASDFGNVLEQYSQNVINSLPVKEFQKYGLMNGKQTKLFTVEEADKLIKVINANQSNDPAVNSALSALRGAVKKAVTDDAGAADVFAPARSAAAQRFKLQEAIPSLAASADNAVNPDTFVDNFIVSKSANTNQVKALAALLRKESPEALDEAKKQIGAYLQRKAFGENPAGDAKFNPASYAKALREMGDDKLSAFFSPKELNSLQRIGRVGSFIESIPAGRQPNTSGNWGAINKISQLVPGVPAVVTAGGAMADMVRRKVGEQSALAAQIPSKPTPEQIRYLSQFLAAGALGTGSAQGQKLNQP